MELVFSLQLPILLLTSNSDPLFHTWHCRVFPARANQCPVVLLDGFDFHLTLRTDVTILPVSCPSLSTTVSASILPALNRAYETAPDPARIKALVFTNPHNPLGQCYTKNVIKEVMRWCGRKEICFVGDEVYGLSEFRQRTGEEGFVSALNIAKELKERKSEDEIDDETNADEKVNNGQELPRTKPNANKSDIDLSRVHIIWSLSKDLGCSGLRMVYLTLLLFLSTSLPQCIL